MIVYGDRSHHVRTADQLARIDTALVQIGSMKPGLERHTALRSAFIALGKLIQGIADADRLRHSADGGSRGEAALMGALVALGRNLHLSWHNGYASPAPPSLPSALPALPPEIELRCPEGYAFYALYPEAYGDAALNLACPEPVRVIGIRGIGVSLAAIVAAVLKAPPPLTIRPIGHPSHRQAAVTSEAGAAIRANASATWLIADEGPGRSGSSFAAVGELLEAHGVRAERQIYLTSHANRPGKAASPPIRARWDRTRSIPATIDITARLTEALTVPGHALQDISAGAWRSRLFAAEDEWPAVDPAGERRKFLIRTGDETWLLKFAGLGDEGKTKLAMARLLHAAGFIPEAKTLVHGFLLQRWIEATPLDPAADPPIEAAARYLAARAHLLPADQHGASPERLSQMALFNVGTALGGAAAASLFRSPPDFTALVSRSRPIRIDGRCDPHEWLKMPDGRLLKADALDHHAGHDLIGCQDLAWDAAGFMAEFSLPPAEALRFLAHLDQGAPRPVDRELLAFLTPCYLAFRLGAATLAAEALRGNPAEAERNRQAAARYARQIVGLRTGGV